MYSKKVMIAVCVVAMTLAFSFTLFGGASEDSEAMNITGDGVEYSIDGTGLYAMVVGFDSTIPANVIIPEDLYEFGSQATVNSIAPKAFEGCTNMVTIDLSNISPQVAFTTGDEAFLNCTNLTTAIMSDDMNLDVNDTTFRGCTSFTTQKIVYQDCKVTYVREGLDLKISAFETTAAPNTLVLNNISSVKYGTNPINVTKVGDSAFLNAVAIKSINLPKVGYVGVSAFQGCTNLTSTGITNLQTAESKAFMGCTSITSFNLIYAQHIGSQAFSGTGITSVNFSASLTFSHLRDRAFENCTSLTEASMPFSLNYNMVATPFYGCTNLSSLTITDHNVTYVKAGSDWIAGPTEDWVTFCIISDKVKDGVLDADLKTVIVGSFTDAQSLDYVEMSKDMNSTLDGSEFNVGDILRIEGVEYFTSYSDITAKPGAINRVTIFSDIMLAGISSPSVVTKIDSSLCKTTMTYLYLYIQTIPSESFVGCTELGTLYIQANDTHIGANAFSNCTALNNVDFMKVATADGNAFSGCTGLLSATMSKEFNSTISNQFSNSGLKFIRIGDIEYAYTKTARGEEFFTAELITPMQSSYTIPETVRDKSGVDLPIRVMDFTAGATEVENVTFDCYMVLSNAFKDCTALKKVTFLRDVGLHPDAFIGCTGIASQYTDRGVVIHGKVSVAAGVPFKGVGDHLTIYYESFATNSAMEGKNLTDSTVTHVLVEGIGYTPVVHGGVNAAFVTGHQGDDTGECYLHDWVIDANGRKLNVVGIEDGVMEGLNYSSVRFPSGILEIGEAAFASCTSLVLTELPASVVKVSPNAFYNTAIEEVTVHAPIAFVDGYAFDSDVIVNVVGSGEISTNATFPHVMNFLSAESITISGFIGTGSISFSKEAVNTSGGNFIEADGSPLSGEGRTQRLFVWNATDNAYVATPTFTQTFVSNGEVIVTEKMSAGFRYIVPTHERQSYILSSWKYGNTELTPGGYAFSASENVTYVAVWSADPSATGPYEALSADDVASILICGAKNPVMNISEALMTIDMTSYLKAFAGESATINMPGGMSWKFSGAAAAGTGTFIPKAAAATLTPEMDAANDSFVNAIYLEFSASGILPFKAEFKMAAESWMKDGRSYDVYFWDAAEKAFVKEADAATVSGGVLTVPLTHCSVFAVSEPPGSGGDNTLLYVGIAAAVIIAALVAVYFLFLRKQ